MEKVNLREKFALIQDYWNPRIAGELNQQCVKLAKLKGEFVWHLHENEDEMFLVVAGSLVVRFRDREIALSEGEFLVVPRGVEHQPFAPQEAHVLLFEPSGTLNTGNTRGEFTREKLERA